MTILPSGQVQITNKATGETKVVDPTDLGNYNPALVSQYQSMKGGSTGVAPITNPTAPTVPTDDTTQAPTITGHTLQEHAQAIEKAKMAGDTNAVKSITDDYDREYSYQKDIGALKNATNKLTPAQQLRHDNLQTAFASLDAAEKNLVTAGGAQGLMGEAALIPFIGKRINPSGAAYHDTKVELATHRPLSKMTKIVPFE